MIKKCLGLACLVLIGGPVYAMPSVDEMESQFQAQVSTRYETYDIPKATCYYDDLVDHDEQGQLMRDVIDEGIR